METIQLNANLREKGKKSILTELRRNGKVPGVFYSKTVEPINIFLEENSINPLVFTSDTHLINLKLNDNTERQCFLKTVQFDPVSDKVIHFDLQGIVQGEKIQIEIPVVLEGTAIGVRDGGLLVQFLHKIEIECLPNEIPENIEINVAELKIGNSVHVEDLKFEQFEILTPADRVIVAVTPPKGIKEADGTVLDEKRTEPEVISKGKDKNTEE
ncbi:MAG: 50S ribosomal protein L25 [Chlorobiaceae bacterium]|nr:50S ribosomal protein L25 [Chlorobiaceae bacterium]MBA4309876.1 50S ribosomal protein L25 [Chlorobiaceae bacterium]